MGQESIYRVGRSETLYRIARKRDLGALAIARINGITGQRARSGATLKLPTLHILPLSPPTGIVLNIPERAVYVFRDGKLVARHAVAVGQPGWQTAQGAYHLRNKATNPTWTPPRSMVEREGVKDDPVPAGPDNPLGDRWMGWSKPGYGFHSTTSPRSIGRAASHGCVRLYPEAAHAMYNQVTVGMPIYSVYKPVEIGKRDGRYYLSVFEDVYGTGSTTLEKVTEDLRRLGLLPLVHLATLKRVVARRDGYPVVIAGEPEQIEVEGKPVVAPLAPALGSGGRWVVPARPVLEALGGRVTADGLGGFVLEDGAHRLTVKPGETAAELDGAATQLPAEATVVEGTLVVPLRALSDAFGLRAENERGKALRISKGPVG